MLPPPPLELWDKTEADPVKALMRKTRCQKREPEPGVFSKSTTPGGYAEP